MIPIKKMICPTDFSDPSYEGLNTAVELAEYFDAELIVLHVVIPMPTIIGVDAPTGFHVPAALTEMEKSAAGMLETVKAERLPAGVNARMMVLVGKPAHKIAETAQKENADLIVMATHGESGWQRFISGSVTERVVRRTECPVLAVPAPEKDSSG